MKLIPLTPNSFALVDDGDYVRLSAHKWYLNSKRNADYAVRHTKQVNLVRGLIYICTNQQNQFNSKKQSNNTSGFKGVSWHKSKNKWVAHIRFFGQLFHLGYFTCLMAAARAYDRKAMEIYGGFAALNFPQETQKQDGIPDLRTK